MWLVVWLSKFGIRFYALWPSLVCMLKCLTTATQILLCMLQNRVLLGCLKQYAVPWSIVRVAYFCHMQRIVIVNYSASFHPPSQR